MKYWREYYLAKHTENILAEEILAIKVKLFIIMRLKLLLGVNFNVCVCCPSGVVDTYRS